jgi:hypothetical protein
MISAQGGKNEVMNAEEKLRVVCSLEGGGFGSIYGTSTAGYGGRGADPSTLNGVEIPRILSVVYSPAGH